MAFFAGGQGSTITKKLVVVSEQPVLEPPHSGYPCLTVFAMEV